MKPQTAIVLALLGLAGCRSTGGLDEGPRLRQDLAPADPPHRAAHGFARYSGEQRFVSEGMDTRLVQVPGVFETLVRRYRHRDGTEIRLVATIHFGRPEYYARLRQELAPCRLVFYEDAQGFSESTGREPSASPRSFAGLQSQRDGLPIASNWQRADLDGAEIRRHLKSVGAEPSGGSRARRGEPPRALPRPRLLLHQAALAFAAVSPGGEPAPIPSRLDRLGPEEFRRRSERDGPPAEDYALIYRRNDVVIAALKEAIAQGARGPIGLVYGAAHGFDLDERLRQELSCEVEEESWVRVWSCREDEEEESS